MIFELFLLVFFFVCFFFPTYCATSHCIVYIIQSQCIKIKCNGRADGHVVLLIGVERKALQSVS